jgi:hypothetical protein
MAETVLAPKPEKNTILPKAWRSSFNESESAAGICISSFGSDGMPEAGGGGGGQKNRVGGGRGVNEGTKKQRGEGGEGG